MTGHLAQSAFIRDSLRNARRLWQHTGGMERVYSFGGMTLRVRLIGGSLQQVVEPVLAHALQPAAEHSSDAAIYALDSALAGCPAPPANWPFEVETEDGNLRTCWKPELGLAMSSDESRGIWHLMDLEMMEGLYWVSDASTLPGWEYGSPLRHFIQWTAQANGQSMVHAAAVSPGPGRPGVLLVGAGGSGKSTMTAAAIEAGWLTTGDDFVIIQAKSRPVTYPVFDVMKLIGNAEMEFPEIAGHAINTSRAQDEKALVPITAVGKSQFTRSLGVCAALSLSLAHAPGSRIEPAGKTQLVAALAPSTMKILRTGLRETFSFCSELVRLLPCYSFTVGNDPREGLSALRNFIDTELAAHG